MTNEELKEKLIGIIRQGFIDADCRKPYTNEPYPFFDSQIICISDALIDAGLRFGENFTATFDHMALEREHELERRLAEAEHRAEVAELVVKNLNDIFTFDYQTVFEQAEKELVEEREDEQT